jgi:hypothetical protein
MRLLRKVNIRKSSKARHRRVSPLDVQRRISRLPRYVLENIHHPVLRMAWAAELRSSSSLHGHFFY